MGQFWVAVLGAAHRQYFVKQSLEQYWYNTWGTVLGQYWGAMLVQYWGWHCGSTGKVLGEVLGGSSKESSW